MILKDKDIKQYPFKNCKTCKNTYNKSKECKICNGVREYIKKDK